MRRLPGQLHPRGRRRGGACACAGLVRVSVGGNCFCFRRRFSPLCRCQGARQPSLVAAWLLPGKHAPSPVPLLPTSLPPKGDARLPCPRRGGGRARRCGVPHRVRGRGRGAVQLRVQPGLRRQDPAQQRDHAPAARPPLRPVRPQRRRQVHADARDRQRPGGARGWLGAVVAGAGVFFGGQEAGQWCPMLSKSLEAAWEPGKQPPCWAGLRRLSSGSGCVSLWLPAARASGASSAWPTLQRPLSNA